MKWRFCAPNIGVLPPPLSYYFKDFKPSDITLHIISGPRSFTGGGARPPTPSSLRSHKSGRSADADKLSRPRSNSNQLSDASNINKQVASVMAASRPRSDTQSPKVAPPQQSSPSISLTSVAGVSELKYFSVDRVHKISFDLEFKVKSE